ncbi:MAG: MFS transporter [Promethearchaeota archaeon]
MCYRSVAFIAIWFPWSTTNQTVMFFHFLITMSMWDMGLTICLMSWLALLPEMEEDINQRLKISWLVSIFMLIAMITGTVLAGFMETNFNSFRMINIVLGIIVVVSTWLSLNLVNEREEYVDDKPLTFWESIKATFKSKSFMLFIGYNFFANVMTRSISFAFIFIYILILPVNMISFFLITSGIGILVSFIGMKLRPKFGMRNILLVTTAIQIVGGLTFYFLSLSSRESIFTLIGFLWITFFGAFHTGFFQTLQGLSMDEDELKTGTRRESAFLGINALLTKPADSFGPMIAIWILELTKYAKNSALSLQPDTAVIGIKSILILLPVIFAFLSWTFIYFYPIHGKYMKKLYADIERMHEEKRAKAENA